MEEKDYDNLNCLKAYDHPLPSVKKRCNRINAKIRRMSVIMNLTVK
jgi:hypothetical protein